MGTRDGGRLAAPAPNSLDSMAGCAGMSGETR